MIPKSPNQTPEYFAQIKDPKKYVDACLEKISIYRQYCSSRGLEGLWETKLSNYYGVSGDAYSSMRVLSGGTEGELTNIKVNDLRSLTQNQLVVITGVRPAGVTKAINSDVKSLRNARIGTALSEFYLTQAGWEQKFVNGAEMALIVDEAYYDVFWDKSAGDPVRPDADESGQPIQKMLMSGDAKLRLHAPWNAARDPDMPVADSKWNILTIPFNRFDLAAEHPEFAEQILKSAQDNVSQMALQARKGSDIVYMHLVVHDRSPSAQEGRYSMIVGDNLIADMDLPYPAYPVDRLTPADVIDGPNGYCASNDVMAMEQITDALHSSVATNNINFGGQNIVGPPLSGINVSELAKGGRYFELPVDMVDKIKPLQLTQSAPETYQYIQTLNAKKQETLGSVTGTLQAQATQGASGSAMALIQAQAVQFNSGTQRSYYRVISSVMTKLIGVLRVYADTPRVVKIVGKSKSRGLKEFKFTGKDLDSISSIVFEIVNPMAQTVGGRLQMAQDLISKGLITSAKQYLTVAETGSLDAMTNPDEDIDLLILEENEQLSEGQQVSVVITENHQDHIKAHMSVIASPEAKSDPALIQNVLAHIQEHLDVWQDASMNNPNILLATGQQPLPPPPPPPGMMPPQGPGGPGSPPPNGPQGGPPQGPGPVGPPPGADNQGDQPNMPQMPVNPATGERVPAPGAAA